MMEIKNLKKAAERILKAIKNKEKIILYGDADPDGVASIIILKETIEDLGGSVSAVYFPDREEEGYGINQKALRNLAKFSPALFIALDCGIGNVKEVEIANKLGLEIIIIDHHQMLPEVPRASIVVNPKQKTDKYPFKELSSAGIVYRLVKSLLVKEKKWQEPERFLELVALATISDMMPIRDENKELVEEGISALNYTSRLALKILIELTDFEEGERIEGIQKKILPPLNAASTIDHLNESYLFLIEKDVKKAESLAKILIKKSEQKREERKRILEEVEEIINAFSDPIIFEGDPSWPLVLLGPVASKICYQYKTPIFLFKKMEKESPGVVRTPEGIDGVKAMINCRKFLETYGGHPLAAGFRIKNENLEKFKNCLIKYFS